MANISFGGIGSIFHCHSSTGKSPNNTNIEDVVKQGYLIERKNKKKRYFVLRKKTSEEKPARLEYYNSENITGYPPKKTYVLKECFNIDRKKDKNDHVITLYINHVCVDLISKTKEELQDWLEKLQSNRNCSEEQNKLPMIPYEHIWPVEVLPESSTRSQIIGKHWLCLTNRLISIIKVDDVQIKNEIQFSTIRTCGIVNKKFFLQMGRYSVTGEGKVLMLTQSCSEARKIYETVNRTLSNFKNESGARIQSALSKKMTETSSNYVPMNSGIHYHPSSPVAMPRSPASPRSPPHFLYLRNWSTPSPTESAYVPMLSPGTEVSLLSQCRSEPSSHYLPMGFEDDGDGMRIVPLDGIPFDDGICYEVFPTDMICSDDRVHFSQNLS